MPESPQLVKGQWLTDAVIISYLTAISYGLSFAYQAGVAFFYSIPLSMVRVEITMVLVVLAALAPALILLVQIVDNMLMMREPRTAVSAVVRGSIFQVLVFCIPALYVEAPTPVWIVIAFLLLFNIFIELILPFFRFKHLLTYEEKVRAQMELFTENTKKDIMNRVSSSFGLLPGHAVLASLMLVLFSFLLGQRDARRRIDYPVIRGTPERVVLAIYNERVISATFDRKTKTLSGVFTVQTLADPKGLELSIEPVGPIKKKGDLTAR